jgi:thiosulfate dehydrogenase [quinone] large subunit
MERQQIIRRARGTVLTDPTLLRDLLADVRFAPLWLVPRIAVGWTLLAAGRLRLQATSVPSAHQASVVGLPGSGGALAIALTLAGIAVILGVMTGPAAFVGGCLGAGICATERPIVLAIRFAAVLWLVLAWKTAGWIGFDHWLLPLSGMPWSRGPLFQGSRDDAHAAGRTGQFLRRPAETGARKESHP